MDLSSSERFEVLDDRAGMRDVGERGHHPLREWPWLPACKLLGRELSEYGNDRKALHGMFQRRTSGLLVPPQKKQFICAYELDERLDLGLANLFQRMYRAIASLPGDELKMRVRQRQGVRHEVIPDPVHAWIIYLAALIQGASDSALTLVLHNLGREARILERQAFEYLTKAMYYQRHPRQAKQELEVEPFRELHLLDLIGYDKRSKRYRDVKKLCRELAVKRPALAKYAHKTRHAVPPRVSDTLGREGRRSKTMYAHNYRLPSQTVHATVLGMRDILKEEGIKFDSRQDNPNLTILFMARYVLVFLKVIDQVFTLDKADVVKGFEAELVPVEGRLFAAMGALDTRKQTPKL